jgi:hypothetical protein
MTDIVKGMARAYVDAWDLLGAELEPSDRMRAALMWLADNVSDEMVQAYREALERQARDPWLPSIAESKAIAAAIRAAAGGEG